MVWFVEEEGDHKYSLLLLVEPLRVALEANLRILGAYFHIHVIMYSTTVIKPLSPLHILFVNVCLWICI